MYLCAVRVDDIVKLRPDLVLSLGNPTGHVDITGYPLDSLLCWCLSVYITSSASAAVLILLTNDEQRVDGGEYRKERIYPQCNCINSEHVGPARMLASTRTALP